MWRANSFGYVIFGAQGHILSDEDYEFMLKKGAIEKPIDESAEDVLVKEDMKKYLLYDSDNE